jgi:hypothetical protein
MHIGKEKVIQGKHVSVFVVKNARDKAYKMMYELTLAFKELVKH